MRKLYTFSLVVFLLVMPTQAQQVPAEVSEIVKQLDVLLKRLVVLTTPEEPTTPPVQNVIRVPAGGNLQQALDAVPIGGTVALAQGAVFTGNFSIRRALTLTTDGVEFGTRRVTPSDDSVMAKIVSTNVIYALDVSVSGVNITKVHISGHSDDAILVGQSGPRQTTLADVPRKIVIDQVRVHGAEPVNTSTQPGMKRGIALHGAEVTVTRSDVRNVKRVGQDTQAIGGWNGPGPFVIHDNYLEAAGENIMFGGASPTLQGVVPCGITITSNHLPKDLAWRTQNWTVKNHFELKAACNVVLRGNLLENNWVKNQTGYSIVLTPVNPGNLPEAVVRDVLIEDNVIRNTSSGIQVIGYAVNQDTRPTLQTTNVVVRNNWFTLDKNTYGGQGWFLNKGGAVHTLVIENNTIEQNGNMFIQAYGAPSPSFRFVGNLVRSAGQYGIQSYSGGTGWMHAQNWQAHFTGGVIENNAIFSFSRPANLPNNLHVTTGDVVDGYGLNGLATYGRRR